MNRQRVMEGIVGGNQLVLGLIVRGVDATSTAKRCKHASVGRSASQIYFSLYIYII